jgi:hypothetical protein
MMNIINAANNNGEVDNGLSGANCLLFWGPFIVSAHSNQQMNRSAITASLEAKDNETIENNQRTQRSCNMLLIMTIA